MRTSGIRHPVLGRYAMLSSANLCNTNTAPNAASLAPGKIHIILIIIIAEMVVGWCGDGVENAK